MKIVFFPLFTDPLELNQYVQRAIWYLYPLNSAISDVIFLKDSKCSFNFKKIDILDSSILPAYDKFTALKIKSGSENSLILELKDANFVFVHNENLRNKLINIKNEYSLKFEIIRVDYKNVQHADSFMLRFAEKIEGLHKSYYSISAERINRFLPALKSKKAYLFGTGPNFEFTKGYDFSDGLVIACNSMVVNDEIIEKLDPKLFVIADPIFHAGPSIYAASFRKSFLSVLGRKNCPVVVPLRDYHIYSCYFPYEIVQRLIPIQFKNKESESDGPLLNVLEDKAVRTTSNILTLFQLPLASTLADDIYISGCDGRPLTQNNYFWSHNKSVQINDKMTEIQEAHPAFFNISYDDYYSKHMETLESWIFEIERKEKRVFNLTPSYIPALQKRTVDILLKELRPTKTNDLSVIVPLYNAENYLKEAIDSVVNDCKGHINYEIIIVDDFSEDNSLLLAKSLSENNKRIKIYQNFRGKGVSGARNTGILLSNSKAICFLDADDFIYPGSVTSRFNKIVNCPEIDAVHSTLLFVDKSGNCLDVEVGVRRDISFKDCSGNPASFNTLMFNNKTIRKVWFNEELKNGEDWLALADFLRRGFTSKYVQSGKASYRIHEKSTVISDFSGHEDGLLPVIKWLHENLGEVEGKYQHASPLPNSTEAIILRRRKLNKLIMSLFNRKIAYGIRQYISKEDASILFDKGFDFFGVLKVPFVRSFQISFKHPERLPLEDKMRINRNLEALDAIFPGNSLSPAIRTLLEIKEFNIYKTPLQEANRLFRSKKTIEALEKYREIYSSNKFYEFVEFNIMLCKERLREH